MSKRNVLSKKNVEVLADSIRLYMGSIKDKIMFKVSVNMGIEDIINMMVCSENLGADNLAILQEQDKELQKKHDEKEARYREEARAEAVEQLKEAGMLR